MVKTENLGWSIFAGKVGWNHAGGMVLKGGGGRVGNPLQTMDPNYIFAQQMVFTFVHALNSFNNQE